jgi:hypothetical protein
MLEFVPYEREWIPSVKAFNQRMLAGGLELELRYPEEPNDPLCAGDQGILYREYFLAVEGSEVRGAYFLTHERWAADGHCHHVSNLRLPLSEGFVNQRYKGTGTALLKHALARSPLLYCLGLGSRKRPLAQMLMAQNWFFADTDFFFHCVNPRDVLCGLTWLRTKPTLRIAMDIAAKTGGWRGISASQGLRERKPSQSTALACAGAFDSWADELWEKSRGAYSLLAERTCSALAVRYPSCDSRYIRLLISSGSKPCGWAVLLATQMRDHRHFGNLKVGTIVDCLALPGHEHCVIHAATGFLEEQGVQLIVSNQSHRAWQTALERSGYLRGPTNRFFTASPDLARLLDPFPQKFPLSHLTRGDGAGPIHL